MSANYFPTNLMLVPCAERIQQTKKQAVFAQKTSFWQEMTPFWRVRSTKNG